MQLSYYVRYSADINNNKIEELLSTLRKKAVSLHAAIFVLNTIAHAFLNTIAFVFETKNFNYRHSNQYSVT